MSETFVYGKPKSSRVTGRRREQGRTELFVNRFLWTVIVLLALFALGEVIFHFVISPRLLIKSIIIESDIPFVKEELVRIAGLKEKEYFFKLDTNSLEENLIAYPLIKNARVEKEFPGTLNFKIQFRVPLLMSFAEVSGRSVPLVFDEEGLVFQIGQSVTAWDLPVLSGLKFVDIKVGMKLPQMLLPFFQGFAQLRDTQADLFRLISEIRVNPQSGGRFELVLYPLTFGINVRFGNHIDSEAFKQAIMILDLLKNQGLSESVEELDFRTGEVIYRVKKEG